jgi:hypothetical protein
MNRELFNKFLTKEMDRKEFLIHIGLIIITITGVSSILKSLLGIISRENYPKQIHGFGSGPYGK